MILRSRGWNANQFACFILRTTQRMVMPWQMYEYSINLNSLMNAWAVVYLSVLFILENGALEKWKYS